MKLKEFFDSTPRVIDLAIACSFTVAIAFSRNVKVNKIFEQAEFAAEVIPDEQIEELEAKVGASKLILDEALPN